MRRMTRALAMTAAIVALAAPPLAAGKPSGPKPKPTAAKAQAPKPAKPPKSTTVSAPKAAKATAPKASAPKASATSAKAKTPTTLPAPTPAPGTWTPTNPIAQKLSTKPNHLAKLQSILPPGTDLNLATLGFKNFGQLNAAVNNSINHNIPFADLKAAMTGIRLDGTRTGLAPVSLGQAKKQIATTTSPPPGGDE
jgi:hypothetical protein